MGKVLLKEMTEEFIQIHAPRKLKNSTVECYQHAFKRMYLYHPMLEKIQATDLTTHTFQICIDELQEHYAKSSINHIRAAFSRAYYYAIKYERCALNPIQGIEIPKDAPQKEVYALTADEQKILEAYLPIDPLGHAAMFLLYTGLRKDELEKLTLSDWNKENNTLRIRKSKSKTGVRTVPLVLRSTACLYAAQSLYRKEKGSNSLFLNTKGEPLKYTSLRLLCERIERNTGLPHVRPHMFRHSFATRYLEKGGEIKALSQILGHKSVAFTMERYLHPDIEYLAAQMNIFAGGEKYA